MSHLRMRALTSVAFAMLLAGCDAVPTITIREARPGEVHLIRRELIAATIHRRHPDEKAVGLYCPYGVPEVSTKPTIMRFSVQTDDYDRFVPPESTVVWATIEVRTNGWWVTELQPRGVDESYPVEKRRKAEQWQLARANPRM